jgi:hypothetical protein
MAVVTKGELPLNNSTMPEIATVKLIFVSLFMASILAYLVARLARCTLDGLSGSFPDIFSP